MVDPANRGVQAGEEQPRWRPAPAKAQLAAGAVHVWRADLGAPPARLLELLCAQERARAARFAAPVDGLRWSHARAILRALLGGYLERDPSELRFRTGAHGKPALAEQPTRCFFNVSHSGDVGLFAFSLNTAVGVDIELAQRDRDLLALATRIFGREQGQRLSGLAPSIREREFLRMWVRYEARLKCDGSGIGGPSGDGPEPWLAELDVGPRAAAAVAAGREPSQLCCWNFAGS